MAQNATKSEKLKSKWTEATITSQGKASPGIRMCVVKLHVNPFFFEHDINSMNFAHLEVTDLRYGEVKANQGKVC